MRPILLLILIVLVNTIAAQESDYRWHRKIVSDTLYLRWEPTSYTAFRRAVDGELGLEVANVTGPIGRKVTSVLGRYTPEPLPYETWRNNLNYTSWDSLTLAAIHLEQLDEGFREESFFARAYGDTPGEEREARWRVANEAMKYEWAAIERSGMGLAVPLSEGGGILAIKLFPNAVAGDTLYLEVDRDAYRPPQIPSLTGSWKNRLVELNWRTFEYKPDFFGWMLEKSVNGRPFTTIFDQALVNEMDTLATVDDLLKQI
ncbi:MAG: hypothetical protein AAFN92_04895, partial [Bacteroidota bacterium]